MFWPKPLNPLFYSDAEGVHHFVSRILHLLERWGCFRSPEKEEYRVQLLGRSFENPIGLAAGFDKNAILLEASRFFGFGYTELGTVTPLPQSGNDRPRLLRDVSNQSLWNRMGFNNDGAEVIAERIRSALPKLPESFRIGVNIGKNRDVSLADAPQDYAKCASFFGGLADYLVINVSSPNTVGLRRLQQKEALLPIIASVKEAIAKFESHRADGKTPLLVKFSPEFILEGFEDQAAPLIEEILREEVSGIVLTNTWEVNWPLDEGLRCGASGKVLKDRAFEALKCVRQAFPSTSLISVGGIDSEEEAVRRRENGADLIQIYTAWIYEGPFFSKKMCQGLVYV